MFIIYNNSSLNYIAYCSIIQTKEEKKQRLLIFFSKQFLLRLLWKEKFSKL